MRSSRCLSRPRCPLLAVVLATWAIAPAAFAAAGSEGCARLAGLELNSAQVVSAAPDSSGSFELPGGGRPIPISKPFCRVVVSARPSKDSDIRIEVWLPFESAWNGRLWGVGNSTWAGYIPYRAIATRLEAGYVAVGTDTGHQAKAGDSTWARGHPEKIIDYGHRGIHEAAVAAKRVAAAYYGRQAGHAYFSGCSTGGRHALMEAQRYPGDYDGIIGGDPDYDSTLLYAGIAQMQRNWMADPARTLPPSKIPAMQAAALAACDRADGIEDGVINHPPSCKFDPQVLACDGPETDHCLTPPQLATLRDIHEGVPVPALRRTFAGYAVGSEEDWDWVHLGPGGPGTSDGFKEAMAFYRDLVFADPEWNSSRFDPARDSLLADTRLGPVLNASDPDLRRFAARGGKLILFQGWNDPAVAAMSTIGYYRRVVATVGDKVAGASVRLFMAPGMAHCGGGPGPNRFGQSAAGEGDPQSSLGAALQRWVEQGIAPERITATKLKDDGDLASEVLRTRPLCAYPRIAQYRGAGSTDDAVNFGCVAPK